MILASRGLQAELECLKLLGEISQVAGNPTPNLDHLYLPFLDVSAEESRADVGEKRRR